MVSTSGSKLLADDAMAALTGKLLPLATVITPNLPEVHALCGIDIRDAEDMKLAAKTIYDRYS